MNGNGTAWELAEACDLPVDFIQQAADFHSHRPRRIAVKTLPAEAQALIRRRVTRAEPVTLPDPLPPPPRVPLSEIRPRAKKRAARLLGYKPDAELWRDINSAARNELVFTYPEWEGARWLRQPNDLWTSRFIRRIYKECFRTA